MTGLTTNIKGDEFGSDSDSLGRFYKDDAVTSLDDSSAQQAEPTAQYWSYVSHTNSLDSLCGSFLFVNTLQKYVLCKILYQWWCDHHTESSSSIDAKVIVLRGIFDFIIIRVNATDYQ
jgi:hypothetical protein